MFTGIIEVTAHVIAVTNTDDGRRLKIETLWPDLQLGNSVAVNGACLTVSTIAPKAVEFDVVPETLKKTNLSLLNPGDEVHLERPMLANGRIDGHFVLGHIDGTGKLNMQSSDDSGTRLSIACPPDLVHYLTPRGSIAIDGVSLTIAAVSGKSFDVALIPETLRRTLLDRRPPGWPFNLEMDIISKTVVGWLERRK